MGESVRIVLAPGQDTLPERWSTRALRSSQSALRSEVTCAGRSPGKLSIRFVPGALLMCAEMS